MGDVEGVTEARVVSGERASTPAPAAAEVRTSPGRRAAPPPGGAPREAPPGDGLRFALGASGWLFAYHLGVVQRLRELRLNREATCVGSSGGALAGAFLFIDDVWPLEVCEFLAECAEDSRASGLRGVFKIGEYVNQAIARFAAGDAHELLSGRFTASVTELRSPLRGRGAWPFLRNRRVGAEGFASREALRETMLASTNALPMAGLPRFHSVLGCFATDGMFSELQLIKGWARDGTFCLTHQDVCRRTVTISAWYWSRADIRPSTFLPIFWAWLAPPPDALRACFDLGYADAQAWVERAAEAADGEAADDANAPVGRAAKAALQQAKPADLARLDAAKRIGGFTGGWRLASERVHGGSSGGAGVAAFIRVASRQGRGAYIWASFAFIFACRLVALWLVYLELNLQGAASAWIGAIQAAVRRQIPSRKLGRVGSAHMLLRSASYYRKALSPRVALLWLRQGLQKDEVEGLLTLSLVFRVCSFLF